MEHRGAAFAFAVCFFVAGWACTGDDPDLGGGSGGTSTSGGTGTSGSSNTDAGGTGATDSAVASDAPSTTNPACDLTKPFAAPIPVSELNTVEFSEGSPYLSPDRLTIYFSRTRGLADEPSDLWTASRTTVDGVFSNIRRIDELASGHKVASPSISSDGLFLYFSSNKPFDGGAAGTSDLYAAVRDDLESPFKAPTRLSFSTNQEDITPFLLPNGVLYSAVRGENPTPPPTFDGKYRLYRSTLPNGPRTLLSSPPNIPGAETAGPVVTPDELMIAFSSTHTGVGHKGFWDIYISRRSTKEEAWGSPEIQLSLNYEGNDFAHWISPDGCEIWMSRGETDGVGTINGNHTDEIYLARRPPL